MFSRDSVTVYSIYHGIFLYLYRYCPVTLSQCPVYIREYSSTCTGIVPSLCHRVQYISGNIPLPVQVLSRDSVTVSVDAVVYYRVSNPTMATNNIEDYR